ncbi:MAG: glycoside hydrolase family 13 protein [Lachnospiraceae bacterium]|nr:glycoside hydrolase family 13 protein [Lachnospiraceae bacterium]
MLKEAVFSDGTSDYRDPCEPGINETVRIRIRTATQTIRSVMIMIDDKKIKMSLVERDSMFDYYEGVILLGDQQIRYYFLLQTKEQEYYYTTLGISDTLNLEYQFVITPGFHTPDWAKGAVFYQIFVDRFYNGDSSNDVLDNEYKYIGEGTVEVKDWNKYPDPMGVREFYGGDLLGIMKKLDYLKELGVEVIYLNPIFVSPSNHKYDIQDYDYIDPHYGVILKDSGECLVNMSQTNKDATRYIQRVTNKENLEASNRLFIMLVQQIHERGMKIILDGVFNHCGSFNKWLDREEIYEKANDFEKGAYITKNSPYHSFFQFRKEEWPYNNSYDGWWGHDTLPKLNYEHSPKLKEYILEIARKWVSPPFNADGWRLDVAADLGFTEEYNHQFWKEFRKVVKEANPNALILAEHYGDAGSWLNGDEWDSVMNYDAFMEPITWFLTGVEKHSDQYRSDMLCNYENFYGSMTHYMSKFQTPSLQVAMNELSNHDHSRFLTRTNHKVGRTTNLGPVAANENLNMGIMREAVVMQMTWPGAPTIYYGDEAGVCGWTDPDNRRTYPWGHENKELIHLHQELIQMRKSYSALRLGSIKFLTGTHGVVCYARFNREDQFIIIVNNNHYEVTISVPVWQAGIPRDYPLVRMLYTDMVSFGVEAASYYPQQGSIQMNMNAFSSVILKNYPCGLY